jgi:hypothetical protein
MLKMTLMLLDYLSLLFKTLKSNKKHLLKANFYFKREGKPFERLARYTFLRSQTHLDIDNSIRIPSYG